MRLRQRDAPSRNRPGSATRFRGGGEPTYRVIVSNEAYVVGQRSLDLLMKGIPPQELDLEPARDETVD
jgi:hypothetical protein